MALSGSMERLYERNYPLECPFYACRYVESSNRKRVFCRMSEISIKSSTGAAKFEIIE